MVRRRSVSLIRSGKFFETGEVNGASARDSSPLPAKNADVQVWITVPSLKIQEHHNMSGVRFEPGSSHRLTVNYNAASKTFSYVLN